MTEVHLVSLFQRYGQDNATKDNTKARWYKKMKKKKEQKRCRWKEWFSYINWMIEIYYTCWICYEYECVCVCRLNALTKNYNRTFILPSSFVFLNSYILIIELVDFSQAQRSTLKPMAVCSSTIESNRPLSW